MHSFKFIFKSESGTLKKDIEGLLNRVIADREDARLNLAEKSMD